MPKKYRLSGLEIRSLAGKRVHSPLFSLLIAPIPGTHAKCAVVVSKKAAAKAVDRNKMKRRMRSTLAKRIAAIRKPVALVLYAKREVRSAAFADIEHDIAALLAKVESR